MFAPDVTEGGLNDLSISLSSFAVGQGWKGIERTPVESVDSTEVEKLLREDFYDGESFRRLVNEPLLYAVAAWLIVAYLTIVMRGDIGYEWRQLRRAVTESQWSSHYERDWPENRDGIVARIQSRIAHWISEQKTEFEWPSFGPAISRRFGLKKLPNPETLSGVTEQHRIKFAARFLRPGHSPLHPLRTPQNHCLSNVRSSGSSLSDAVHSQSEPWDESKWID